MKPVFIRQKEMFFGRVWRYGYSAMVGLFRGTLLLCFVLATVGVAFAGQSKPSRTPEQGVTKHDARLGAEKSETTDKEPSSSPNVTVVAIQENPLSHKSDENKGDENIAIQRKLANFTFWLVVVGFIQAFILAFTVYAIYRQSEIAWHTQRAQLAVEAHGNPLTDLVSNHPRVQLELVNKGMTPAYYCAYETWIEILPRDCEDFTQLAEHFKAQNTFVLFQGHGPMVINIPFQKGLPIAQKEDVGHARKTAFVRIRITYEDSRKTGRFIDVGFRVDLHGLSPLAKYSEGN